MSTKDQKNESSLLFEFKLSEHVVSEAALLSVLEQVALGANHKVAVRRPHGTKLSYQLVSRPVDFLDRQLFLRLLLLTIPDLFNPDLPNVTSPVQFGQCHGWLTDDNSRIMESDRVEGRKHSERFARMLLQVVLEYQVWRQAPEHTIGTAELVSDLQTTILLE